jgi:hypothetical protein
MTEKADGKSSHEAQMLEESGKPGAQLPACCRPGTISSELQPTKHLRTEYDTVSSSALNEQILRYTSRGNTNSMDTDKSHTTMLASKSYEQSSE